MRSTNSGSIIQKAQRALRLLVFPLAEAVFLISAWFATPGHPKTAAVCVLFAAISLSYSLHIVFHEIVHHGLFKHPVLVFISEWVMTLLLGTPFNEYRQSHWQHHRFTNLIEDATSTWRATPDGPKPRRFLSYSLGWPAIVPRSSKLVFRDKQSGRISDRVMARIYSEAGLLLVTHLLLAYFAFWLWVAYAATIYLGYVGIAAINYIQHPPIEYGSGFTSSIYSPTYNLLLHNNGLHFEHHDRAHEPTIELTATPGKGSLYARPPRRERQNQEVVSTNWPLTVRHKV